VKRIVSILAVLAVAGISYNASAHAMSKHNTGSHDTAKHAASTIMGEVVDAGCYLGHSGRGKAHAECAARCISGGMPMALLTKQGALYLLTMNHDNPDPYNKLKEMAGKTVTVTGVMMTRSGLKGIDVASIKPMAL
jgi:hypothetical protein